MSSAPLVSVITPVYNAVKFLPRLMQSVRDQKDVQYEHILVDDCSTDGSLAVLLESAASDDRVTILQLKANRGVIEARNAGVSVARGRYLAFLDADDLWLPDKLAIQSRFMLDTSAVLSFTDYRFISEDGKKVGRLLVGPRKVGWSMHHMTRFLGCLTVMVDFHKCPDFTFGEISSDYRAEDFLAWAKVIAVHGPALRCPFDLARYSLVKNSRSSNVSRAALSVFRLYRDVEKIPLPLASLFFLSYSLFAIFKRIYCRPDWNRLLIDGDVRLKGKL